MDSLLANTMSLHITVSPHPCTFSLRDPASGATWVSPPTLKALKSTYILMTPKNVSSARTSLQRAKSLTPPAKT